MLNFSSLDDAYKIPSREVSRERDEIRQINKIIQDYEQTPQRTPHSPYVPSSSPWMGHKPHPQPVPQAAPGPQPQLPQHHAVGGPAAGPMYASGPAAGPRAATQLKEPRQPRSTPRNPHKEALDLIDQMLKNPVLSKYIKHKTKHMHPAPTYTFKGVKETFENAWSNTVGCQDIKGYLTVFLLIITIYLGVSLFMDYMKNRKIVVGGGGGMSGVGGPPVVPLPTQVPSYTGIPITKNLF